MRARACSPRTRVASYKGGGSCAEGEVVDAIGAPGVQVLLNDFTQPLEEWEVTHAGQWKDRFRRIGFVPFAAFGASPEKAQEMRVEVWKRTRDLELDLGGWVVPALR